jgi:hypothetical protein
MWCLADNPGLPFSVLAYSLFVLLAIVGPAMALLRLLRLSIDVALVVPLGLCYCAGAFWLSLILAAPWTFPAVTLALDIAAVWLMLRDRRLAPGPNVYGAVPVFLAFVALFALIQYPVNRCDSRGGFRLDPVERHDTSFHVALTWELSHCYPPQVPGLAGVTLRYHIGAHLVRAAAVRWAGVHPYDALARFELTLMSLALILALRSVTWHMGGSRRLVALAPWLLLASDFSFLMAEVPRARFWADMLGTTFLSCLFFVNAAVPALMLTLACLVAIERYRAREGGGWLIAACLFAAAVPIFKVFMIVQLLAALLTAAALLRRYRAPLAIVTAAGAVSTALLVAWSRGGHLQIGIDLAAPIHAVRDFLELPRADSRALLPWILPWLFASLGLRLAGIPEAVRSIRASRACVVVVSVIALSSWPLRFTDITADEHFNESVYFTVQSGVLLWIFTAAALLRLAERWRRPVAIALLGAALCLPSTIEFILRKASTPLDEIPPDVVLAMSLLDSLGRPGDVILEPTYTRLPPPPIVFIGRRVAFSEYLPYRSQFAAPELLRRREWLVRRFFKTRETQEAREIAREVGADFVFLYGRQRFRFDPTSLLQPVYESPAARLYRVTRIPKRPPIPAP